MLIIPSFVGRNNDVFDHFCGNTIVKVKIKGNMMYVYGLDHGELGEHFLVLKILLFVLGHQVHGTQYFSPKGS